MWACVHVRQRCLIFIVGAPPPSMLCEVIHELSILLCPPPLLLPQPLSFLPHSGFRAACTHLSLRWTEAAFAHNSDSYRIPNWPIWALLKQGGNEVEGEPKWPRSGWDLGSLSSQHGDDFMPTAVASDDESCWLIFPPLNREVSDWTVI